MAKQQTKIDATKDQSQAPDAPTDTKPEGAGDAGTDGAADQSQAPDAIPEVALKPLRSKFIVQRREEVVMPGGAVQFNVVLDVVGPKRDAQAKTLASVNDALWAQNTKPIGTITLASMKLETALLFQIGGEYHVDFSPVLEAAN